MRKSPVRIFFLTLLVFCAVPFAASAQTGSEAPQALEAFPDSQAVLYINAHRIIREAMSRVMPPAEYQKMLSGARLAGFDPLDLRYIVGGVRFVDPAPQSGMPEFLLVVNGDFSADALLSAARLVFGSEEGKIRSETYGSKTLNIIDLRSTSKPGDAASGDAEKSAAGDGAKQEGAAPSPPPFPELATVALDANTLAVGVPDFVRAAIDAGMGQGRLKATTVALASRDPQSLMSLTAVLPENISETLARYGMKSDDQVSRIIDSLEQFNLGVGMNASDFTIKAAMLTGSAEQANIINGLLSFGLMAVKEAATKDANKKQKVAEARKARAILKVVNTMTHEVEGATVALGFTVSQQAVAELVKEEMAKKGGLRKNRKARPSKKRGATRKR